MEGNACGSDRWRLYCYDDQGPKIFVVGNRKRKKGLSWGVEGLVEVINGY